MPKFTDAYFLSKSERALTLGDDFADPATNKKIYIEQYLVGPNTKYRLVIHDKSGATPDITYELKGKIPPDTGA